MIYILYDIGALWISYYIYIYIYIGRYLTSWHAALFRSCGFAAPSRPRWPPKNNLVEITNPREKRHRHTPAWKSLVFHRYVTRYYAGVDRGRLHDDESSVTHRASPFIPIIQCIIVYYISVFACVCVYCVHCVVSHIFCDVVRGVKSTRYYVGARLKKYSTNCASLKSSY